MGYTTFLTFSWLITLSFGEFQLALIHTNDIHARIEQTNKYSSSCTAKDAEQERCYGGVARIGTKIQELRQQYPDNSLLVDAGDQFQGSLWSTHYKGNESAHFMNILGYDIMTLGNHDFDYGIQTLRGFMDKLTFPVVASNLEAGDTALNDTYTRSHVFTLNQRKVGVIGFVLSRMAVVQLADKIEGLTFNDEIESVRKEAIKLKSEGVDIIIALGHSGHLIDKKVAKGVEQVDIVIGAHSHTFLYTGDPPSNDLPLDDYPVVIERTSGGKALVITEYAYSKYLGFLKVNFTDDGEVSSWEGQPILLDSSVQQDPEINATVTNWSQPLLAIQQEVVGESHVFLEGDSIGRARVCRKRECGMGNLVADAALWSYVKGRAPSDTQWSKVAVAVWNGGGIRINLVPGPITLGDVLTALPFRNLVRGARMPGKVLLEMLENSVSGIGPTPSGRYLQISGMRVKYDLEKPVGERVVSVSLRCSDCIIPVFEPLNKTKMYTVLLNSFMASGGDGYDMIPQEGIIYIDTLASDALKDYLMQFSPIITGLEGRIEYVTEENENGSAAATPTPSPETTCAGNRASLKAMLLLSTFILLCHST